MRSEPIYVVWPKDLAIDGPGSQEILLSLNVLKRMSNRNITVTIPGDQIYVDIQRVIDTSSART